MGDFVAARSGFSLARFVLGGALLSGLVLTSAPMAQAADGGVTAAGLVASSPANVALTPVPAEPGTAVTITPTRFLDTRTSSGDVGPGGSVSFQVAGVHGVPADASAVVVNITVTIPSSLRTNRSFGFVTAHASGTATPNASNVNYEAGQTVSNLAVVPIGADGKVTLTNTSQYGGVSLVADVSAYYLGGAPTAPGAFGALAPTRFLDTRTSGKVGPGGSVSFQAGGVAGVPADAAAVVVNLTVTEPSSYGFVTAHASGTSTPNASNVNYLMDQTIPNLAVVPLGPDGKVTLTNTSSGSVQLVADVSGYFLAGTPVDAGAFGKLAPTRFLDTRTSSGPVAGGGIVSFQVAGVNGVPANVAGVWVNLTVTETQGDGFLTGFASGTPAPGTSNLIYGWTHKTVANMAYLPVGTDGKVSVANNAPGSAQIIADVSGYVLK